MPTSTTSCGRSSPGTPEAKALGYKAGDFSYNTGKLRCPVCDGTGSISLDVQFLPDVDIPCPECRGSRYGKEADRVQYRDPGRGGLLPAGADGHGHPHRPGGLRRTGSWSASGWQVLQDLGLGYLTLGEATPSLSGGEAQRLKLASEMGRGQADTVFVFDEPTIGLHPLDVRTLLGVFQTLIGQRRHGGGHRARPGCDPRRRLHHRHGPRRRARPAGRIVRRRHPRAGPAACPGSVTGRYLR